MQWLTAAGGHPVSRLNFLRAHYWGGLNAMAWWQQCPLLADMAGNVFYSRSKEVIFWSVCVCIKSLRSCLNICILCTVTRQDPLSMRFSRQDYWSGLPWPPPGDLPNPATEPAFLMSSALAGRFFTTSTTWETPFSGVIEHFQLISISQENGRGLPIPTSKLLCVWPFSEKTFEVCSFSLGFLCPFFLLLGLACPFLELWLWYLPLPIPSTPDPQHWGFFLVTVICTLICFLSVLSKAVCVHVIIETLFAGFLLEGQGLLNPGTRKRNKTKFLPSRSSS